MGINKSTQFNNFDKITSQTTNKLNKLNSTYSFKHIPEYPPLILLKNNSTQTYFNSSSSSFLINFNSFKFNFKLKYLIYFLFFYFLFFILLGISNSSQNILIYLNIINFPFYNLKDLNYYGLYNGRNIQYFTDDNKIINGWHILPPGEISWNNSKIKNKILKEKYFNDELRKAKTIIIQLHGNAANRGVSRRIDLMKQLSSELSAHVIAIDYRGYGDSSGWPSESGTTKDLFGLWKWLENILSSDQSLSLSTNHKPKIIIYGLSLGTGIAVEFLYHLKQYQQSQNQSTSQLNLYPSGLILNSPFSSIKDAIYDYPYTTPLRVIPFVFRFV